MGIKPWVLTHKYNYNGLHKLRIKSSRIATMCRAKACLGAQVYTCKGYNISNNARFTLFFIGAFSYKNEF